jgi:hypothetical protein
VTCSKGTTEPHAHSSCPLLQAPAFIGFDVEHQSLPTLLGAVRATILPSFHLDTGMVYVNYLVPLATGKPDAKPVCPRSAGNQNAEQNWIKPCRGKPFGSMMVGIGKSNRKFLL